MVKLILRDDTTSGLSVAAGDLEMPSVEVTLRDILRERIYKEAALYNEAQPERFKGLIQPSWDERLLNGDSDRRIDAERQYQYALRCFAQNGFLVLAGERQIVDLDEPLTVAEGEEIRFLKLVPLVGG